VCLFIVLALIQMQALTWPLLALLGFLAVCATVPVFVTQFAFNTAFFMLLATFVPHAFGNLACRPPARGSRSRCLALAWWWGAPRLLRQLAFGTIVALGPLAGLLGALLMALTIWLPTAPLAGLGFFQLGAGPILWVISTTTLRQTVTPPDLLGRVSAINIMAYGARPIGSALGALLGGLFGVKTCLLAAVAGFLIQAIIIAKSPVVTLPQHPRLA
jgi:hypothetical protein